MPLQCPACGEEVGGQDAFCEACGHDLEAPAVRWEAVVTVDRNRFDALGPIGLAFPADYPTWTLALDRDAVALDRRTLLGDPGISRDHAMIIRTPSGVAVIDNGSLNGTTLNDEAVAQSRATALHDGDVLRLGAWTTLEIHAVVNRDDE